MLSFKLKQLQKLKEHFLITILIIVLLTRLIYLGLDSYNYDACCDRWFYRSDRFAEAFQSLNLEQTYQKYHPGVTLMYLSSIGKTIFGNITIYPYNQFINDLFWSKFLVVVAESILIIYSLSMLLKASISKEQLTYLGIMLAFEPYFLGINKFLHVTGLVSVLFFAIISTMYYYSQLNKLEWKNYIVLSFLVAILILSKFTGVIIAPFILILLLNKNIKFKNNKEILLNFVKQCLIILILTIIIIYILFPALWLNPINLIAKMYTDGFLDTATSTNNNWGPIINLRYLYFYENYFLRSSLTIIPAVLSVIYLFINRQKLKNDSIFLIISILFIIYYSFVMVIPGKVNERYITPLFPFVLYSASYFIANFRFINKYIKIACLTGYMLLIYVNYFPSHSLYYNDLIMGQKGYEKLTHSEVNYRGESYVFATYYINKLEGENENYTIYYPNKGIRDSIKDVAMNNYEHNGEEYATYIIADKYNEQFLRKGVERCTKIKVIENYIYSKIENIRIYKCN